MRFKRMYECVLLGALRALETRLNLGVDYFSIHLQSDGSGVLMGGRNIDNVFCKWRSIEEGAEKIARLAKKLGGQWVEQEGALSPPVSPPAA